MKRLINPARSKERRRELRKRMTQAERVIWCHLSHDALGVRCRRQHGIGPFIVDFCFWPLRLVIEIDGKIHEKLGHRIYDMQREAYLIGAGFHVMRIKNEEVFQDVESVVGRIHEEVKRLQGK